MKKLLFIISFTILAFSSSPVFNNSIEYAVPLSEVIEYENQQEIIRSYEKFKEHLGFLESTNRYNAISHSGSFVGRYQFGRMALEDIGMLEYYPNEFLASPYLQEKALYKNLLKNKFYLRNAIKDFDGKIINDILITKSSILAGAHLLGASSVQRYLYSGGKVDLTDGNGTKISSYFREFSDKDFQFNDYIIIHIEKTYGI